MYVYIYIYIYMPRDVAAHLHEDHRGVEQRGEDEDEDAWGVSGYNILA